METTPSPAKSSQERTRQRQMGAISDVLMAFCFLAAVRLAGTFANSTTLLQTFSSPPCLDGRGFGIVPSPFFEEDRTLFLVRSDADYYDGSYHTEIWRSTDNAASWTLIYQLSHRYNPSFREFAISPVRSPSGLILYMRYRTGALFPSFVFARSMDSGDTWEEWPFDCENCAAFALRATDQAGTIFAPLVALPWWTPMAPGIYRSDDGGENWQQVWAETGAWDVYSVANFAKNPILYAILYTRSPTWGTALITSRDGGLTWEPRTDEICAGDVINEIALSPDFINDQTLFAVEPTGGALKSNDGGLSWQRIYPRGGSPCGYYEEWVVDIRPSPDYSSDHTVFLSTRYALYASYDDGVTWRRLIGVPRSHFSISRRPSPVVHTTYLPLAASGTSSSDVFRTYLPLLEGQGQLPIPRPLTIFVKVGLYDDYYYRSDDGGVTWQCLNLPPSQP